MNYQKISFRTLLVSVCFILCSCGGSSGNNNIPADPPPMNVRPTAVAGDNQTITNEQTVSLAGSASDSDGSVTSVTWTQTSGPMVDLSDVNSLTPDFTRTYSSQSVTLNFTLSVTDNDGASSSDDIEIVINASQVIAGNFDNISGLQYASGDLSGTTANGVFEYLEGADISFSVGGLNLGSVLGTQNINPLFLSFSQSSPEVFSVNLARFLSSLDVDGNNGNGITISEAVISSAQSWDPIDFNSQDFDMLVAMILADIELADNRPITLPSADDTQSELELGYACLASGIYSGTFSGDDTGTFVLLIDAYRSDAAFGNEPRIGTTSAAIYSSLENQFYFTGFNESGLSFDESQGIIAGEVDSGATFSGSISNFQSVTGSWENRSEGDTGSFTGQKTISSNESLFRLSGLILTDNVVPDGNNSGGVTIDIQSDNTASGAIVFADGTQILLNGNYAPELDLVSLTGPDILVNIVYTETVEDALQPGLGFFAGLWEGLGTSGGVGGFSCQLNPDT